MLIYRYKPSAITVSTAWSGNTLSISGMLCRQVYAKSNSGDTVFDLTITDPEGVVVYFLYHGKAQTDEVKIQEGEIAGYKWLTLEELKNFPKNDLREVMGFVIKKIEKQRRLPVDIIYEGNE